MKTRIGTDAADRHTVVAVVGVRRVETGARAEEEVVSVVGIVHDRRPIVTVAASVVDVAGIGAAGAVDHTGAQVIIWSARLDIESDEVLLNI